MDYQKLGLKIGLEIHQQLEGKKLFCSCPTTLRDDEPQFTISRKLRAVAGESGSVDVAAKHEQEKDTTFIYEGYDSTCLVETDSEPPHEINSEALIASLQVSTILNASIPSTIQIMRKTVVDGSNTSGFQRTGLVGYNGSLSTSFGDVSIDNISIEEDACKIVKKEKNKRIFRLDRLGIPLIEIGTGPHMHTPEQAIEVAKKLGNILRSLSNVKRGLGTIRQDVNISIKGGNRVELKGVQDLKSMKKVIDTEIKRQMKGKVQKEVRKANADGTSKFMRPMPGASRMYPETDVPLIKPSKKIDLPELLDERIKRFSKSLSKDLAEKMAKSDKSDLFEELIKKYKIKPAFIADVLTSFLTEIRRKYDEDTSKITDNNFKELFELLHKGVIHKDIVLDVLIDYSKGTFNVKKYESVSTEDIHKELIKIIKSHKNAPFGALMGMAVRKLAGKASGQIISKELKKLLDEGHA